MVTVAQLVEPRIVIPVVAGSNPVSHPNYLISFLVYRIFQVIMAMRLSWALFILLRMLF